MSSLFFYTPYRQILDCNFAPRTLASRLVTCYNPLERNL